MGVVALIELSPRRPADGVVVPLRFVWNAATRADFFGQDWRPEVEALPDFESDLGFDGANFGQSATPQVGALRLRPADLSLAGLVWKGAAVSIRTAPLAWNGPGDPADGAFDTARPFRVAEASWAAGALTLTLLDAGEPLRRPAVALRYGTSGIALLDGTDTQDLHGRPVSVGWGRLFSVPCRLVDRANNIWLALGRPAASIAGIFDGGAAFDVGSARASLAALQATAPAEGAADWCLDAGGLTLVRPWTEPTFPLTADLTATGPTLPGAIATALVAARGGPAFASGTVAAFDALYPFESGLFIEDETSVAAALDRIVGGLGGWWRLNSAGLITLGRLSHAAPAATFAATAVNGIERLGLVMPTRRRGVGYARNNRVHSEGEIAAALLVDFVSGLGALAVEDAVDFASQVTGAAKPEPNATRNVGGGTYSGTATYQPGDMVNWGVAGGGDGGGYVRIGSGGTTGVAPSDATKWARLVERGAPGAASVTGQSVSLGLTVSATLSFTLQPAGSEGDSRAVLGSAAFQAPTGAGSAYVQIETREEGGTWSVSDGGAEAYAVGEPAFPTNSVSLVNTADVAVRYEARGTVIRSNTNSGPLTGSRSTLAI